MTETFYMTNFGDPLDNLVTMYEQIMEIDNWTVGEEAMIGRVAKLVRASKAQVDTQKFFELLTMAEGILQPDKSTLDYNYIYGSM